MATFTAPLAEPNWERALLYFYRSKPPVPEAGAKLVTALGPALKAPSLILTGDSDKTISPEGSRNVARLLGAAFSIVPDCGHILMDEKPAEFIDAVARHCERYTTFKMASRAAIGAPSSRD